MQSLFFPRMKERDKRGSARRVMLFMVGHKKTHLLDQCLLLNIPFCVVKAFYLASILRLLGAPSFTLATSIYYYH